MSGHPSALALITKVFAETIRPIERIPFSQWLPKNIVLVDGAHAGEMWSADGAPYLVEIADCLSDEHPCNLVTVRKSQQSGASILALAWCLYIADQEPANTLYGTPGIESLRKLNGQKLQPLIDAWHKKIGRTVIWPQTSRSAAGSTTYEKRFAGGFLSLANVNAIMDLSMVTAKKGVKDEVSKWQLLDNGADPENLFFGRFTAFRRTKNWKILEISTPEIDSGDERGEADGHCRIDRSFKRSDQRYWHCLCPECGQRFVHEFARLRIDEQHPHRTRYEHECGHLLSEAERVVAVRQGIWIPRVPGEYRHPGFHVDAFISLMMSYEAIAEDSLKAKTETAKKDFSTLVLGLPYKYSGDVPDYQRLLARREPDLKRGHVPPMGLLLVAFADVQMRGIWYEVMAVAPNRETWCVDAGYIDGDTSDPNGSAFVQLRKETVDREFPDAFGRIRRLDALGIDSGYRAPVVYAWVRGNQRIHPDTGRDVILATKGLKGWSRPPIGAPSLVDIDLGGRKIREGAKVWGIGTWPLKTQVYSHLRIEMPAPPAPPVAPDCYCHFGAWLDENYFRQLTAESLRDVRFRGRITGQEWVKDGPNHFLDCRVGNLALAEYLGLSFTTPAEWSALARARGLPEELARIDLFTPRPAAPVLDAKDAGAAAADRKAAERRAPVAVSAAAADWLDGYEVRF